MQTPDFHKGFTIGNFAKFLKSCRSDFVELLGNYSLPRKTLPKIWLGEEGDLVSTTGLSKNPIMQLMKSKGAWVVATPDGVWHRDSHYWRKFIVGVHKVQILVRELLEELLRNFFGAEIGGVRGTPTP